MRTREALLEGINDELPDLDWQAGARAYLAHFFETFGQAPIEGFVMSKPLGLVNADDPQGALGEIVTLLNNFANSLQLLKLPYGARVLDVACGGGWVSHWLTKLGYRTFGVDISPDFIAMARRRLGMDPHLDLAPAELEAMFAIHDLEREPLLKPEGGFDAALLESCLHHFVDPIAALSHIAEALSEDGVVLILELDNRRGPIPPEPMKVMLETQTLERSYPRELLVEVLEHAGLPHYAFLGAVNGLFAEGSPEARHMTEHLQHAQQNANICICARNERALRRVVPLYDKPTTLEAAGPARHARPLLDLAYRLTPSWARPPARWVRRRIAGR